MLCRMMSKKKRAGVVPVYLNVYDLTSINGYAYWLGLGVYHSGLEVHGVEYGFGAHDHHTTGVFEVEPRLCPGFTFRKQILIGRTDLGAKEVQALMEKLSKQYLGNTYNLISKNCNDFCNDLSVHLTGKPIPSWVNRLARLGLLCKCVLPAALDDTKVGQVRTQRKKRSEGEKKKLRSQSSRFETSNCSSSNEPSLATAPASRSRRQRRCVPPSSSLICSYPRREVVV